jgi:hypothetical protein
MPCTFPIPKLQESLFYLIGQKVGQIVKLPHEELPTSWSPIWMIRMGSSLGQAIFCGCDIAESYLIHEMHYDEHNLREWREILWHQRKRILPPPQPAMRKLWRKFQAEVSHVC